MAKCWRRPSWNVSESLEHLLCRLHYDSREGGGGHLLKSPVGGHQNLPDLICQRLISASWLGAWLPATSGSVFPHLEP